ncbi:MAG: 4-hydroxy-3-methylbut-2-enyl diphosphate reductase [Verrucomicrobiales bacterium]|nr:4-hydroxy-3-methylbut-2-enyl diphosphate reductase [Verrucomicrobiales bacterium]
MIIQRAQHLGMCFGVRDAIALAKSEATKGPLTILGDLVHNESVLADLRQRGVHIERRLESVATHRLMITAHGASETRLREVQQRGHGILEATCPLVRFAHDRVAQLVRDGFHPVIIGQRDHVEVRGLTEDLAAYDVVLSDDDIRQLSPRDRFGVAAQTTQPLPKVQALLAALRRRFPEAEVRFADTVCLPTKQRQKAAEDLATVSDVVLVVGGPQSNNTRELVATCRRFCSRVHHVQSAADLSPNWFRSCDRVGITAGTSTPDPIVDGIEAWLRRLDEAWEWNHEAAVATTAQAKHETLVPAG